MKGDFVKKYLIVAALAFASACAMAHGPPSALDQGVVAQTGITASVSSGSGEFLSDSPGINMAAHGGGSGGITQMPSHIGRDTAPNERMLN